MLAWAMTGMKPTAINLEFCTERAMTWVKQLNFDVTKQNGKRVLERACWGLLVSCKYVFYQWRTFCLQKNWFFPASILPHPVDGSNYGFWTEDDCLTSESESINLSLRVFISLGIHCYEPIKRSCITMMLVWWNEHVHLMHPSSLLLEV